MYSPITANFSRRVRESGVRKTVVDVYYDNQPVATDLVVSGGNIRVDLDGQIRRSGQITIADLRLIPTLSSILVPQGTEIRVRQGVVYPSGSEELIPLGIFPLEVTDWGEIDKAPKLQIYDRSRIMSQSGLANVVSRSGRMAQSVVVEFLEWFFPALAPIDPVEVFDATLTDFRLPGGHTFEQGDYWSAISDLCRSMNGRLHFDVSGAPKCTQIQDNALGQPVVLTVDAGESGILVDANHSYSRSDVYNAVSVVGAANESGAVPSAVAYNLDSSSPLRYDGPFGKVVLTVNDSSLTTEAQCYQRAVTELKKYTGLSYGLDFSSVPNPALDAGDFVRFTFPDGSSEIHQISTLSIPLGKGQFTGTSRGGYLNG